MCVVKRVPFKGRRVPDDEEYLHLWFHPASPARYREENPEDWKPQHFAFTTNEADIEHAATELRARGVEVSGPVTHDWMPARSIYFSDPDGHALELCAPLAK